MLPNQKKQQEPSQEQDSNPYLLPEEIQGSPFNPDLTSSEVETALSALRREHLKDLKEKQAKNP